MKILKTHKGDMLIAPKKEKAIRKKRKHYEYPPFSGSYEYKTILLGHGACCDGCSSAKRLDVNEGAAILIECLHEESHRDKDFLERRFYNNNSISQPSVHDYCKVSSRLVVFRLSEDIVTFLLAQELFVEDVVKRRPHMKLIMLPPRYTSRLIEVR